MKTALIVRAALPFCLAACALLSGPAAAQTAPAPATAAPPSDVQLTRDQVERDLAAWKQSGVERNWDSDSTPDINSPQYVADYKKYVDTVRPANAPQMQQQSQGQGKW